MATMTNEQLNEQQQREGKPYYRVTDLTPGQFEAMVKRAVYRGGSLAVVVGLIAVSMLWGLLAVLLAILRQT